MENRPTGRQRNDSGKSASVNKRGDGVAGGRISTRPEQPAKREQYGSNYDTRPVVRGKVPKIGFLGIVIILIIVFILMKNPSIITNLLGGGGGLLSNLPISSVNNSQEAQNSWTRAANTLELNREVSPKARDKYTDIKASGNKVTLMVYMCGTDLESKYGMATADIKEMAAATENDNVKIIIYCGGCSNWKTGEIDESKNNIYQLKNGKLHLLKSETARAMTDPKTLSDFITYATEKYPANRNMLIFWDHGGGSISGYGYDEKFPKSGSMSLAGIDTALKTAYEKGDVRYDFIGFDACLMATAENALMLSKYADYMIASEETEPGTGWYYTNWLTLLARDTGTSTLDLGKQIIDDYTKKNKESSSSAKTTLSLVDLSEFQNTFPDTLTAFADNVTTLVSEDYSKVSEARTGCREFSTSSKIDQVDLVHLADRIGGKQAKALADSVLGAVKYNKTSAQMTNSYGLSMYFPCRSTTSTKVKKAVNDLENAGVDESYTKAIASFAAVQNVGQTAGGSTSALPSLTDILPGGNNVTTSLLTSLLSSYIGGTKAIDLDVNKAAQYIEENSLSDTDFQIKNGKISLSEEKWSLINDIELNVFADDGEGYIDLGFDNVFEYDKKGNLICEYDGLWMSVDDQIVAYYYDGTTSDSRNWTINGRIPCLLNGQRAFLVVVFDNAHVNGYVQGAILNYELAEDAIDTDAKIVALTEGDTIDFIADYYSYSGEYNNTYMIGKQIVYNGSNLKIADMHLENGAVATFRFTDIYNKHYWSGKF